MTFKIQEGDFRYKLLVFDPVKYARWLILKTTKSIDIQDDRVCVKTQSVGSKRQKLPRKLYDDMKGGRRFFLSKNKEAKSKMAIIQVQS